MANHRPVEGEFISGNRDGPKGRNDTYNICRFDVPKVQFKAEESLGLHPSYLEHRVSPGWRCPAHSRANPAVSIAPGGIPKALPQRVEIVHRDVLVRDRPTCVVCRLGVDRNQLVREVRAGLHPGYRTITIHGETYVQGIGTGKNPDNVNFGASECSFRLKTP